MTEGFSFILFLLLLLTTAPLLGSWMAKVFEGQPHFLQKILKWLEQGIYRFAKINPQHEMTSKEYLVSVLIFNGLGLAVLLFILLFQHFLPFNPQQFLGLDLALAFNTAASFVTNTNWQAYSGETTLSYFSQAAGLTAQNFMSAATGNAVLLSLIRGLKRSNTSYLGNFWMDLTRGIVYLLLPLCVVLAFFLISQGVIQNFSPYLEIVTLEKENQILPMGPVASQEAIKLIGTNGGGFFNANSAHPFENPTPLSNFVQNFMILLIPASAFFMYGKMLGSIRQGLILFIVSFSLWGLSLCIAATSEYLTQPAMPINSQLEGKETRIGVTGSVFWAINTTATSNGSVNNTLSTLSPLASGMALTNIMLGEVIFGGVGVGLCSLIMYVLLTVFLAGLMVGRTPEYLGKKIEKNEMQWVMLAILTPSLLILIGAAWAIVYENALRSLSNKGPHGLTEILYAFSSAAGNNGSAFQGLNANTFFYNVILGCIMLACRLAVLIPSLLIAGSLVKKMTLAPSLGTFPTDRLFFSTMLFFLIIIVGALTFFPALSLGPIVEHYLLLKGRTF